MQALQKQDKSDDEESVQERREIEKALFNGDILGVAATNALELGVDVGGLDMTMHLGFQGISAPHCSPYSHPAWSEGRTTV